MDWVGIGNRIRRQREFLGYTREELAEMIDVTTKFCSDIELGLKGMSIPTLCRISKTLQLSMDYILLGEQSQELDTPVLEMMRKCPESKRKHLETVIKAFLMAIDNG